MEDSTCSSSETRCCSDHCAPQTDLQSNTIGSPSPSWRHCLADSNASGKLRGSEYWGQGHRKGRIQLENLRFLVSNLTTKVRQLGQSARSDLWGVIEETNQTPSPQPADVPQGTSTVRQRQEHQHRVRERTGNTNWP